MYNMFKSYNTNNMCSEYNTVHVIRHLHSSTHYGIRKYIHPKNKFSDTSFIVCFENEKDALHVMKSISTYKAVYHKNPDQNKLCLYNIPDLLHDKWAPIQYGLYTKEIYLTDLLTNIFQRNIGLCLINDIYLDNKDNNNLNINIPLQIRVHSEPLG